MPRLKQICSEIIQISLLQTELVRLYVTMYTNSTLARICIVFCFCFLKTPGLTRKSRICKQTSAKRPRVERSFIIWHGKALLQIAAKATITVENALTDGCNKIKMKVIANLCTQRASSLTKDGNFLGDSLFCGQMEKF